MSFDHTQIKQIAASLARHFESLYYIEIESGNFVQFIPERQMEMVEFPDSGEDFFELARENASKFIHPADLDKVLEIYDRKRLRELLDKERSYSVSCRSILNGKVMHLRHIVIMCDDREHIISCLENIEEEFREKEEQKRNLYNAQLMARRDELTGIKNKNAFTEHAAEIDAKISSGECSRGFGVVMCDMNDLKLINDTRGHSYGDEALQRTSRMICDIFKHSPVYRTGGDEFVVILSGNDYDDREILLKKLRDESDADERLRTGPTVASGLAVYERGADEDFTSVFERADQLMYENKKEIKSRKMLEGYRKLDVIDEIIPDERRRLLDGMFGALYTIAGEGYVYINDMRYDFSRWSVSLIHDFGLESMYMYHAGKIWDEYVHPDDLSVYREAVEAVFGGGETRAIHYRARRRDGRYVALHTRCFVLNDANGEPEYFGGIIIPDSD